MQLERPTCWLLKVRIIVRRVANGEFRAWPCDFLKYVHLSAKSSHWYVSLQRVWSRAEGDGDKANMYMKGLGRLCEVRSEQEADIISVTQRPPPSLNIPHYQLTREKQHGHTVTMCASFPASA